MGLHYHFLDKPNSLRIRRLEEDMSRSHGTVGLGMKELHAERLAQLVF